MHLNDAEFVWSLITPQWMQDKFFMLSPEKQM